MIIIEEIDLTYDVYDITVEDNHNFYANDILVHNCLEITLPTKPFINTIEDGYTTEYIIAKDEKAKAKLEKLVATYKFVPRKYEGKLFKRVTDATQIKDNIDNVIHTNVQDKTDAEMALCILAAINLGNVENLYDGRFEKMIYATVRALDNLIDDQEYPVRAAEISAKMRRTLGVGVTNFAYYLAKRGLRYSDGSANKATHELFEAFQYYLIKASVALAKERGACEWFDQTKYAKGILPIDTYHKGLDEAIGKFDYKLDWEALRADVLKYGMRHSTLSAQMPVESSSKTTSSTNGIEIPKELYSVKDGVPFVVPEINELFANYETMWEQPSMTGYMNIVGIMQKFMDQAISGNTFYDPSRYGGKVPLKNIIKDIIYGYRIGWKTMYYHYTNDDDKKEDTKDLPSGGDDDGEDCESCKI